MPQYSKDFKSLSCLAFIAICVAETTSVYTCDNRYRNKTCNAQNLDAKETETAVKTAVKNWGQAVDLADFADKLSKHNQVYKKDDSKERAEYLQLEREIFNITTAIKKGIVYDELMTELETSKARMKELETILQVNIATNTVAKTAQLQILEKLKYDITNIDDTAAEALVKTYVRKITVCGDHLDILLGVVTMNGSGGTQHIIVTTLRVPRTKRIVG